MSHIIEKQFTRENIWKKNSFEITFLFLYNISLLAETDLKDNSLLYLQRVDWKKKRSCWVSTDNRRSGTDGEALSSRRKIYLCATLSTSNLMWTGVILNPGLRDERPTTNSLIHSTTRVHVWCVHSSCFLHDSPGCGPDVPAFVSEPWHRATGESTGRGAKYNQIPANNRIFVRRESVI
jgi:hypothetical protein